MYVCKPPKGYAVFEPVGYRTDPMVSGIFGMELHTKDGL